MATSVFLGDKSRSSVLLGDKSRSAVTATGKSPLVFVPSGVKLNSQQYFSDILEGELLP